ncbi:C40 family peptidase [Flavobacterium agricola]|uniref:C40 family peptidase n=1 Tax=Flavobacterium agricola TaxID=2870839 RepID=A0ABY6M0N0_9FLAO|nr:C40 family peptidase [Flavobacterium agricola]UYW02054.1 C40 family peptidase [Flavobacterium agricola]
MHGICILANIPLRLEPNDRSEMTTQVLFGDFFKITEEQGSWYKIVLEYDQYEGWVDAKQVFKISETSFATLQKTPLAVSGDIIEYVSAENGLLLPIHLGSDLRFLSLPDINTFNFSFDGTLYQGKNKEVILNTAYLYLNAPYLWGGKTPFGIDCSGFTQMVYKTAGYAIPRDAYQQAAVGEVLSFIEEAEPGDLAFFDNEEGKIIHVGIILANNFIIHASGQVRIDKLDYQGIYNVDTGRHTHKLRVIRKIV